MALLLSIWSCFKTLVGYFDVFVNLIIFITYIIKPLDEWRILQEKKKKNPRIYGLVKWAFGARLVAQSNTGSAVSASWGLELSISASNGHISGAEEVKSEKCASTTIKHKTKGILVFTPSHYFIVSNFWRQSLISFSLLTEHCYKI